MITINLFFVTFGIVIAYGLMGYLLSSRLSKHIENCDDSYFLLLHMQQHALTGKKFEYEVSTEAGDAEYKRLKKFVSYSFSVIFSLLLLTFVSNFLGW